MLYGCKGTGSVQYFLLEILVHSIVSNALVMSYLASLHQSGNNPLYYIE